PSLRPSKLSGCVWPTSAFPSWWRLCPFPCLMLASPLPTPSPHPHPYPYPHPRRRPLSSPALRSSMSRCVSVCDATGPLTRPPSSHVSMPFFLSVFMDTSRVATFRLIQTPRPNFRRILQLALFPFEPWSFVFFFSTLFSFPRLPSSSLSQHQMPSL